MGGSGSGRRVRALALWSAASIFAVVLSAMNAGADVYKWFDENGVAHYTTDPDALPAPAPALSELPEGLPAVRAAHRSLGSEDSDALDGVLSDRFAVYGLPGPRPLPPPRRVPRPRAWPDDPQGRLALE